MIKVIVSKEARHDLLNIYDYITEDLSNSDAALRILDMLKQSISALAEMPQRGKPLDSILPVHTEYRFLICENYRIFYLCDNDAVEIVRILHTLQDYMRVLFT